MCWNFNGFPIGIVMEKYPSLSLKVPISSTKMFTPWIGLLAAFMTLPCMVMVFAYTEDRIRTNINCW